MHLKIAYSDCQDMIPFQYTTHLEQFDTIYAPQEILHGKKKYYMVIYVNLIENETLAHVFSCEFCKMFENSFFTEHLWVTTSVK